MDYYSIKELDRTGLVITAFTSKGLGCWLSNSPEGHASYREVAEHFGISPEQMVGTFQCHSDIVRPVTKAANGGEYTIRRTEPIEVRDGIVTNERGLMLCSMESDCTPVFLLDPVKRAIGMIHSGWKGTASLIAVHGVEAMEQNYGSRPEDILAAFGPCICENCYEVSDDLFEPFSAHFTQAECQSFFAPKANGKYNLNVKAAIRVSLQRVGIVPEHIFDCGRCTYHENIFYSHRMQIKTGEPTSDNMFTGIMLL